MKLATILMLFSTLRDTGGMLCSLETIGSVDTRGDGYDSAGKQVLAVDYQSECCGLADSWTLRSRNGVIHLQVWRPTGSSFYLQWTRQVTISSGVHVERIPVAESLIVQPGDVLGWYADTAQVLYKRATRNERSAILYDQPATLQTNLGQPPVEPLILDDVEYILYMTVSQRNAPKLSITTSSMTKFVSEVSVGQILMRLTASDSDPKDNLTFTVSGSSVLVLQGQDLVVKAPVPKGLHSVSINVRDTCGLTDSAMFTLTVVNRPPVVDSLPSSVSVPEDNSASVLLHTLTSSDADGDPVSCSYTGPHSDKFVVRLIPGSKAQGVYLKYPVTLNTTVKDVYDLSVSCSDGIDSVTSNLTVFVTPSNRPVIINLPHSVTIESTLPLASNVYDVIAADVEKDTISFSFTCPSLLCPFSIYPTGAVLLDQSLVFTTQGAYVLDVIACDHRRCSDAKSLIIFITDLQTVPSITNLPQTVSVPENQDKGVVLAVFSVMDADGDTEFHFHLESSPHTQKISLDAEGRCIKLGGDSTLDYETDPTSYVLTVTASDAYYSSLPKTLTVHVIDVNEAPVLSTSHYVISHREDQAGTELPRPAYALRDPDIGDSHSYWLVGDGASSSSLLSLDRDTGRPSFAVDYDVDTSTRPSVLTFQVDIRDSGGLSTTATVTLSVIDVNDNAPDCGESLYFTSLAREATLGTHVFSRTVTDADSGVNARLSYSLQHPRGMEAVLGLRSQGLLYLHKSLSSLPQDSFNVTVTATDGGTPPLSCSYGVLVEISSVTRGFLELNMSWFVSFVMLLMLTGGLAALYVARYCCNGCCKEAACLRKKGSISIKHKVSPNRIAVETTPRLRGNVLKSSPLNRWSGSPHPIAPTDVEPSSYGQPWNYWNSSDK